MLKNKIDISQYQIHLEVETIGILCKYIFISKEMKIDVLDAVETAISVLNLTLRDSRRLESALKVRARASEPAPQRSIIVSEDESSLLEP